MGETIDWCFAGRRTFGRGTRRSSRVPGRWRLSRWRLSRWRLKRRTPRRSVVDEKHHRRATDGDEEAPKVEARRAHYPDAVEQKAADHRASDAERKVQQNAGTGAVHELACDEPSHEPEQHPHDDRHTASLWPLRRARSGWLPSPVGLVYRVLSSARASPMARITGATRRK